MTSQKFEEMSELEANIPVYVITATYPRLEQIAELTRLGQTLKVLTVRIRINYSIEFGGVETRSVYVQCLKLKMFKRLICLLELNFYQYVHIPLCML